MDLKRINVTRSYLPPFEEYIEALKPVWDSRWLSNRGAAVLSLEDKLKEYLGVEEVCCFASGHVALENEEAAAHITEVMAGVQAEINADWAELQEAVAGAEDPAAVATEGSAAMAEKAFNAAVALLGEYGLI